MKRRKWMALMLCAGIFMADFSGIPLKVSAEQVEQAETTLDDQGTQKDDGENTELIQETEDEKGFGRIGKLLNENMFLPVRDLIMLQTYKKIPYRAIKSTIFFFSYLHFIFPHNNR